MQSLTRKSQTVLPPATDTRRRSGHASPHSQWDKDRLPPAGRAFQRPSSAQAHATDCSAHGPTSPSHGCCLSARYWPCLPEHRRSNGTRGYPWYSSPQLASLWTAHNYRGRNGSSPTRSQDPKRVTNASRHLPTIHSNLAVSVTGCRNQLHPARCRDRGRCWYRRRICPCCQALTESCNRPGYCCYR